MPGPPRKHPDGRRGRPQHERRKPPEETTGEERRFLNARLKSGGRLRIESIDGPDTVGVVRSFNEDNIELKTDDRPALVLRKSRIRYIEELD